MGGREREREGVCAKEQREEHTIPSKHTKQKQPRNKYKMKMFVIHLQISFKLVFALRAVANTEWYPFPPLSFALLGFVEFNRNSKQNMGKCKEQHWNHHHHQQQQTTIHHLKKKMHIKHKVSIKQIYLNATTMRVKTKSLMMWPIAKSWPPLLANELILYREKRNYICQYTLASNENATWVKLSHQMDACIEGVLTCEHRKCFLQPKFWTK